MEKGKRDYRICFIDYMWYVAEKWSEREHNNLNGRMLLFLCWLFAILLPLAIPLLFRIFSWMLAFAVGVLLCFLPGVFCKFRYTPGRREALREHYKGLRQPGRQLGIIVLVAIALTVVDFALMSYFGFIHGA